MLAKIPRFVWIVLGIVLVLFVFWVLKLAVHVDSGTISFTCGLFRQ